MPDSPLNCMWMILKLLLDDIEVLPVSLCVRVAIWTAVSMACTGMAMIVVVMVMVGSSRLPLLGLIYMGTMACMTMMAVSMSSTGMAVVVVVVVMMRFSCLLGLNFGAMMLMMLVPVTSATMVVVVMIMVRFSGLARLTWVYVVFSFAHLVGLVRGVLARTIG